MLKIITNVGDSPEQHEERVNKWINQQKPKIYKITHSVIHIPPNRGAFKYTTFIDYTLSVLENKKLPNNG